MLTQNKCSNLTDKIRVDSIPTLKEQFTQKWKKKSLSTQPHEKLLLSSKKTKTNNTIQRLHAAHPV